MRSEPNAEAGTTHRAQVFLAVLVLAPVTLLLAAFLVLPPVAALTGPHEPSYHDLVVGDRLLRFQRLGNSEWTSAPGDRAWSVVEVDGRRVRIEAEGADGPVAELDMFGVTQYERAP